MRKESFRERLISKAKRSRILLRCIPLSVQHPTSYCKVVVDVNKPTVDR